MLQPKRRKYAKAQKGKVRGVATRGVKLIGSYGLMALECGRIDGKELEAARVAINRRIKKYGKMWIRVFPNVPVTKKPIEVRMGQGKGPVERWIARVRRNKIIIELGKKIPQIVARNALRAAKYKLSILTKIVEKGKERGD